VRVFAWLSFALNVLIIATGGTVRLTASGLGCTEWPVCTPGSLVPTPELGIHGIIEFANRTISGPLLLVALVVVYFSFRLRRQRRDLLVISLLVLALVLVQAFVGAFVVWNDLAAVLVGFHYTVSVIIVAITAIYLVRVYEPAGTRELVVPRGFVLLTFATVLAMAVTIIFGVITTASGPHSGDANVVRNGFDATVMSHVHAWPGYVLAALLLALLLWSARARLAPLPWVLGLLALAGIQILVGIYQARNGLPPVAVGIHMVLAALNAATMTVVVQRLRGVKN
jgi:cytochrome c oxidase assembly protein subunit 15